MKCKECNFKCHRECEPKVPPSCGLPTEYLKLFTEVSNAYKPLLYVGKQSGDTMDLFFTHCNFFHQVLFSFIISPHLVCINLEVMCDLHSLADTDEKWHGWWGGATGARWTLAL